MGQPARAPVLVALLLVVAGIAVTTLPNRIDGASAEEVDCTFSYSVEHRGGVDSVASAFATPLSELNGSQAALFRQWLAGDITNGSITGSQWRALYEDSDLQYWVIHNETRYRVTADTGNCEIWQAIERT